MSIKPIVAIIGFGLIGSSLARALRHHGVAEKLIAIDCDQGTLKTAEGLELADIYNSDISAVKDADIIILCSPVGSYAAISKQIRPHAKKGVVVSDVGSVKAQVEQVFQDVFGDDICHVPAHPVAGTEQSGPEAGFASLFQGRWCILTPGRTTDPNAVKIIEDMWVKIGAKTEKMDAKHHDLVLAITSHVPHLIAYNIVGTASDLEEVTRSEVIKYSAGGFRDFTRIAASDPTMWRDVFLSNKEAVLEMLGRFSEDLTALQRAIRWGDGDALFELFTRTRDIRRRIIDAGQDEATPDFGRHHEDD